MITVTIFLFSILLIIIAAVYVSFQWWSSWPGKAGHVGVVVLGDIGRSPRMQYHCLSLVKQGFTVDFIGYRGTVPHSDIIKCENIALHHLKEPPSVIHVLPRLLAFTCKVIWQCMTLCCVLLSCRAHGAIIVQNPPSIPAIAVCWLVTGINGSRLIIDWHNYGFTILALALKSDHVFVRANKWYERFFSLKSHSNLCVTKAMKIDLHLRWGASADVMYDRPPTMFCPTPLEDQHKLFLKLSRQYPEFRASENTTTAIEKTLFTKRLEGGIVKRMNRPALLMSSTSWTEDEDFSVLLDALERYDHCKKKNMNCPDLLCVITGKGPQKDYYVNLIRRKTWSHVKLCTPWLEAEDYPKLLGSADVGVCLHTSSSGLDLPMKVVDMFGCGLPVCAIHFKCLNELVKNEQNGLIFHTHSELYQQLQKLLSGFPNDCSTLMTMRKNLEDFQSLRWHEAWKKTVLPLVERN